MTRSEFSSALNHTRRWTGVVYIASSVTLMILVFGVGYIWFPELQKLTLVFRDQRKEIGDDGTYGAIVGLLISSFFVAPSMLLPLWFVVIVDRRLGIACPVCGSSLTLWERGSVVLKTGACVKCSATVKGFVRGAHEDERVGAPEQ